jgi:hypothetical protein
VEITAAVAVDLAILTQALDEPDTDLAQTLQQLAADAKLAVRSLVGLTVTVKISDQQIHLSSLEHAAERDDILASLAIPLTPAFDDVGAEPSTVLVLYAGTPGAFTDLAADLAWLSGRDLTEFTLDQHLTLPRGPESHRGLVVLSMINQAIGMLIERGHTREQAEHELDARATRAGVDRRIAASRIVADPDDPAPDRR